MERKDSYIDRVKTANIDTIYKLSKFVDLTMAVLIILQGFFRLVMADNFHTFTGFMLTFYLILFGVGLCCLECNLMRARVWFYFMNYSLGKAIFYTVMALLCFGSGASVNWFDILIGLVCGAVAIVFFFIHIWHKDAEHGYVQKLIEEMNAKRAGQTTSTLNIPAATLNVANRV